MAISRKVAVALAAAALVGGTAGMAQAGIRGMLSVYNHSAAPYHIFVEGERMGTITRGQTMRIPVEDWRGPTELMAIQAGSRGTIRFTRQVRTCQQARWELHTHWQQLRTRGGPEHLRPHRPHHGRWDRHHRPHLRGWGFGIGPGFHGCFTW
jgi:hypothetical protein